MVGIHAWASLNISPSRTARRNASSTHVRAADMSLEKMFIPRVECHSWSSHSASLRSKLLVLGLGPPVLWPSLCEDCSLTPKGPGLQAAREACIALDTLSFPFQSPMSSTFPVAMNMFQTDFTLLDLFTLLMNSFLGFIWFSSSFSKLSTYCWLCGVGISALRSSGSDKNASR